MRKTLFVIAAFASCVPLWGAPINYSINFTLSPGSTPAPTSGSFTYDSAVGFSSFIVQWNGVVFDITAAANSPILTSGASTGCNNRASNFQYGFIIMNQAATGCTGTPTYSWIAGAQGTGSSFDFGFAPVPANGSADNIVALSATAVHTVAGGNWTLTVVPEPATTLLCGIAGLLFAWARSRRRAQS